MARAAFARADLARVALTESGSTENRAFQSDLSNGSQNANQNTPKRRLLKNHSKLKNNHLPLTTGTSRGRQSAAREDSPAQPTPQGKSTAARGR
jgi:hypothetical protein